MTPERLRKIQELYHAVRERKAEERAALLAQTDPDLRREIESLLAERSGGEFLDRPGIQNAVQLLDDSVVTLLAAGACLGPYRIEGKLGEGGMGEVFWAIDTRLGRTVAIKITREQFSARFEREARAISSLNHPNICTLYDVGPNYLVMELVEGETLAARLKRAPLPAEEALQYGTQILAALGEAHRRGITHRDLKPGNVMLTRFGVKVLDFGLAAVEGDETLTTERMVMGTPAYMAPEQREGKPADARSDIYSFGCVLYEMLTGTRVGSRRRRLQSRKLESIVIRCLEEFPARRWQSAPEVQRELAAATPPRRRARAPARAALACLPSYPAPGLADKHTIVLADFENKTGDAVFDQTLRQALGVQMERSTFLALVPEQQIQQVLRLMNRPSQTPLKPEVAREICERTGSAAVLEGSVACLGSQYVLWLRASTCGTGTVLAQEQAQAGKKEEVLNALSRIAVRIRTGLEESLATAQEDSVPLEQVTTSSLEALRAYSSGRIALNAHGDSAAIPHLQRAVAIDPQLAMAYADLSILYWNMGQTDLSIEYTLKAYELRDRVSDRERFWILFLYDRQATGNLPRVLQTLECWVETYPRDWVAFSVLAGWGTLGTGQYERGLHALRQAMRLNPDTAYSYAGAMHSVLLDRFAEAADILQQAAERKVEIPDILITRYYLAFFKGDQAGMEREIARARAEHVEDWMSHSQAMVLARSGQMRQARTMWGHAVAVAQQAGKLGSAALYKAAEAVCEAHSGNMGTAKERARAALDFSKGRDVEYAAAFALARSGDCTSSQRLAADLEKRFPEDTPVQFEYLPTLHALWALARGAALDAIEQLQRALAYDFALPGTAFFAKFGGLYPAYVRGEAYLQAGQGGEAAAEFQKVLDHRGIVFADPIGTLARLQLGRAYVVSGEMTRARKAYAVFFSLWKDADADLPIVKQARAEYARLGKRSSKHAASTVR